MGGARPRRYGVLAIESCGESGEATVRHGSTSSSCSRTFSLEVLEFVRSPHSSLSLSASPRSWEEWEEPIRMGGGEAAVELASIGGATAVGEMDFV